MRAARFEELAVWRESHQLALDLSRLGRRFPSRENYELTSQIRRAARSIPANLAEGVGTQSSATFLRHVGIALGSAAELDSHLILARDEGYLTPEECLRWRERIWKVRGMLWKLAQSLRRAKG